MPRWNRTVVLVTSFIGALFNTLFAIQLFALWRSLRWDSESEWEGSLDPWTVKSLSILGGLSAAYFVTAAVASSIGFAGIFKVRCSLLSALVMRAPNSTCVVHRAYLRTSASIVISPLQISSFAPYRRSLSHTPRSATTPSGPGSVKSSPDMEISCVTWPRSASARRTVNNGSRGPSWCLWASC